MCIHTRRDLYGCIDYSIIIHKNVSKLFILYTKCNHTLLLTTPITIYDIPICILYIVILQFRLSKW